MKEKVSEDIFETECWSYDAISDPYQVFAETFSTASMDFLRRFIKKILHYAEANEIYGQKSPCDVLFFMRVVRSLIKAADHLKEIKNGADNRY